VINSKYINLANNFAQLNIHLKRRIMMFQIQEAISGSAINDSDQDHLFYRLSLYMVHEWFQPHDVILKQGTNNDKVFFISEGIVEVVEEKEDYEFYVHNEMGIFLYLYIL
jgi:CRP-like cAMP-binding protein